MPPGSSTGSTFPVGPGAAEQAGDWIGPYKLLQQIGEGGCGLVYMAEQILTNQHHGTSH